MVESLTELLHGMSRPRFDRTRGLGRIIDAVRALQGNGGGGGAPDFSVWNSDAKPLISGPLDYEYGDGLEGWGIYDFDNEIVAGENIAGLFTRAPAHNAEKLVGIYKSLAPLGNTWSVWTKFCSGGYFPGRNDAAVSGIVLFEDATDYTKRACLIGTSWPPQLAIHKYDNYQTLGIHVPYYVNPVDAFCIRVRKTALNGFAVDVAANNGLGGGTIADDMAEYSTAGSLSTNFIPFTPQHIGIAVDANYGLHYDSGNIWLTGPTIQYFRSRTSDVGMLAPFEGARVKGNYI